VTPAKHAAQAAVSSLVFSSDKDGQAPVLDKRLWTTAKGHKKGAKRALSRPRWFQ